MVREEILKVFVTTVVPLLATALTGTVVWALKKLANKWSAEAKESRLSAVGAKVATLALTTVHEVEATMRVAYSKAAADGQISDEEALLLKTAALNQLKESLGTKGLEELKAIFGIGAGALTGFLGGQIEKQVATIHTREAPVQTAVVLPLVRTPGGLPLP